MIRDMLAVGLIVTGVVLAGAPAADAQSRYPVDPTTRRAIGAKEVAPDDLKRQLDRRDGTVFLIDVRSAASFQRETIPGAINVPIAELEGFLQKVPKDASLYFT